MPALRRAPTASTVAHPSRCGLDNLVAADVEAGADGRTRIPRLGAGASGEQPQPVLRRDRRAQTLSEPGAGCGGRLTRDKQSAGEVSPSTATKRR